MFDIVGKIFVFRLQKYLSFMKKNIFLKNSAYSTLFLVDVFGFRPKFDPYQNAVIGEWSEGDCLAFLLPIFRLKTMITVHIADKVTVGNIISLLCPSLDFHC